MGDQRTQPYLHGILIPDERICDDAIQDQGAGTTDSSFSQAGPRPGAAVPAQDSDLVLETSGSQTKNGHLELLARRAGHPLPAAGSQVWRDVANGDTTSQYKGRDSYGAVTGWDPFAMSADDLLEPAMQVIRLSSGKLIATGFVDSSGNYEVREYVLSTSTWGAGVHIGVQDAATTRASCLVELEDCYDDSSTPRVLLFIVTPDQVQIDVYRSDDEGATWTRHGNRICDNAILDSAGDPPGEILKMDAAFSRREVALQLCFVDGDHGGYVIHQWASADSGGTLQEIARASTPTDNWAEPSISALPDGGFLCTCWVTELSTVGVYSYRFGSAYTDFREGYRTLIWDHGFISARLTVCSWIDEDGTAYVLGIVPYQLTRYELWLSQSRDYGATWDPFNLQVITFKDQVNHLNKFDCVSTFGRAALVTRWAADPNTTYEGDSVACVWLGGYSSHTLPDSTADSKEAFEEVNALTWGDVIETDSDARLYIPIQLPGSFGWGAGGAGTTTLEATGETKISTTAGQTEIYPSTYSSNDTKLMAECALRIPTGNGDQTTDEIALMLRLGDGPAGHECEVSIRMDDTGFRVYDVGGASLLGTQALDFTDKKHIRVAFEYFSSAGEAEVLTWFATDEHARDWTEGPGGTVTDIGPTVNQNRIQWGHLANPGTPPCESYWSLVAFSVLPNAWSEDANFYSLFTSNWTNPEALRPRALAGLPVGIHDGVMVRARSGGAGLGETWDIRTRYDHPVSALDPRKSSSPSRTWRSTADNIQEYIVWALDTKFSESWMESDVLSVFLLGSNLRQVYLEGYKTGGAWTQIAELLADDDYSGLKFLRKGRILRPDTSQVTTAKRYLWPEDHAGDHFDLGAAGDGASRYVKLAHSSGGAWRGSGVTTHRPSLVIDEDDLQGAEVSSGTGAIWRRNFGAVISGHYADDYDYLRLRIPAQHTAEDYYELGTVMIGPVALLAHAWDWGYSYVHAQPLRVTDLPNGRRRASSAGKMGRSFTFSWASTGVDVTQPSIENPDPDWVAVGSGNTPAGIYGDTLRTVEGVVRRVEQAACPIVLLSAIEKLAAGTVQLESRSRAFLYGQLSTDPQTDVVLGDEARTEVESMQPITIREVV